MGEVLQNFSWDETDRRLVVFIPNYNRGDYIRQTVRQFETALAKDAYLILVGNDGEHDDFSDLYDMNVRFFSLPRSGAAPRNGGFIRNYAIRRCKSNLFAQKDPEVFWKRYDDFDNRDILTILSETNGELYRTGLTLDLKDKDENELLLNSNINIQQDRFKVANHEYYRVHWGYCVATKTLQDINGYNEKYKNYGCEDKDIFLRLEKVCKVARDTRWLSIHLWHPIEPYFYAGAAEAEMIYRNDDRNTVKNDEGWGNG